MSLPGLAATITCAVLSSEWIVGPLKVSWSDPVIGAVTSDPPHAASNNARPTTTAAPATRARLGENE